MKDFRETIKHFRDAVHAEASQVEPPAFLRRDREGVRTPVWRWAVAAAVMIAMVAIPVYENAREKRRAAEQLEADEMLMLEVNSWLAQPVPLAMSPLMDYSKLEDSKKD